MAAATARPRVAFQGAGDDSPHCRQPPFAFAIEGGRGARSSESVANAGLRASARRRATLSTALSLLEPGACPHAPGFAENGGQGARRNWLLSGGGAGAESQSDRATALQIVLAPRKGQRPKRSRPNQLFVVDGLDVDIRLSPSCICVA